MAREAEQACALRAQLRDMRKDIASIVRIAAFGAIP